MSLHYRSSHYSNQFPRQLLKSFVAVFMFSFVYTTLGLRGKQKSCPDSNDQQDICEYSLCCPNGVNYLGMWKKSYVTDGIEFTNEEPIEDLEKLEKVGPCYIIDEMATSFYENPTLTHETGVLLYMSVDHPFDMDLELEGNEYFVHMFLNGFINRMFIGVELTPGKLTLNIIGTVPKTEDKMFTVTRNPDPEFGELVTIKHDGNGGFELSKGTTDYFLWTKLNCGTEDGTTGFSKLVEVGALDQIPPPPVNGSVETYSLKFGDHFYPWFETRGESTSGKLEKQTPADFRGKPDFPWFVNIYKDGTFKTTLVGMFDWEKDLNGPQVPFGAYIGQQQKYLFPEATMNAAIEGVDCNWTFTVSRNWVLYNTTKLINWNVAKYRDGHLISTHKLVNIYEIRVGGSDLMFRGTYKVVVDDWKEYVSTNGFTHIRCKLYNPRMSRTIGGFSTDPQFLFDVNENEFRTAKCVGVHECDKDEFIFKVTPGMQEMDCLPEEPETTPVYYIYASKVSGLYYLIRGNLEKEHERSHTFSVCIDSPFVQEKGIYSFAISRKKSIRVPEDALSVSFKSPFDYDTNTVELITAKNVALRYQLKDAQFADDNAAATNEVAE